MSLLKCGSVQLADRHLFQTVFIINAFCECVLHVYKCYTVLIVKLFAGRKRERISFALFLFN